MTPKLMQYWWCIFKNHLITSFLVNNELVVDGDYIRGSRRGGDCHPLFTGQKKEQVVITGLTILDSITVERRG